MMSSSGYGFLENIYMKTNILLCNILLSMKKQHGILQTSVAKILGISIQALTDMKGGRRVFTPAMAEKLLDHYRNEPWADWLARELKELAAPPKGIVILSSPDFKLPPSDSISYAGARPAVPLFKTPQCGIQTPVEEHCDELVELPEWAYPQITADSNPYVMELATDDYSGRLRAGDYVLVLQTVVPNKEVMVVEQAGCLRLARNSLFTEAAKGKPAGWIALDSGVKLKNATPVSSVVGIVMARM